MQRRKLSGDKMEDVRKCEMSVYFWYCTSNQNIQECKTLTIRKTIKLKMECKTKQRVFKKENSSGL